jgi:hypothetical protein
METPLCHSAVPERQQRLFSGRFVPNLMAKTAICRTQQFDSRFLFGRLATEEMACRKKQDYTEKGDQHPRCVCLRNSRNFVPTILIAIVLAIVALAIVRARER